MNEMDGPYVFYIQPQNPTGTGQSHRAQIKPWSYYGSYMKNLHSRPLILGIYLFWWAWSGLGTCVLSCIARDSISPVKKKKEKKQNTLYYTIEDIWWVQFWVHDKYRRCLPPTCFGSIIKQFSIQHWLSLNTMKWWLKCSSMAQKHKMFDSSSIQ